MALRIITHTWQTRAWQIEDDQFWGMVHSGKRLSREWSILENWPSGKSLSGECHTTNFSAVWHSDTEGQYRTTPSSWLKRNYSGCHRAGGLHRTHIVAVRKAQCDRRWSISPHLYRLFVGAKRGAGIKHTSFAKPQKIFAKLASSLQRFVLTMLC